MSFLDNIKLIASELANMSPRTQLEIVKLCKELCIETKNYLVAFDETTLPALNAQIEALQTSMSNLNTLYYNLQEELETAEGNITANANAITTLQNAVETIQTSLLSIYTKSQVDTLLNAKADKVDTYTKTEVNTLLNAKANSADVYTKSETDTLLSAKANQSTTYTKTEVDTALQGKADVSTTYTKSETDTLLNTKQNVIDSTHKLASDNVDDTNQTNKFMTDAEKTKLSGIATGAQVNTIESISVNGTPVQPDANKNVNIVSSGGSTHLYKHKIYFEGSNGYLSSDVYLCCYLYLTTNTNINTIALFNSLVPQYTPVFEADSDGAQGEFIPSIYEDNDGEEIIQIYGFTITNGQLSRDLIELTITNITDTITQLV